jgi:hypothetical protein
MMTWAENELTAMGYATTEEEGPQKWVRENVLELLSTFAEQGHSGYSAPHVAGLFGRLAARKPLTPLTGEDDEWDKIENDLYQNKRFSAVFKNGAEGQAYWSGGIVFWEWFEGEDGEKHKSYFTGRGSRVPVTFPFTVPDEPEYREAQKDG